MRFELVNRFLYEHSGILSTRKKKLGFFETQDYANIMNCEQKKRLSMKVLSRWPTRWSRQTQSQMNISVLRKSSVVKSQIQSHLSSQFQTQFQEELQNMSQRHNFVMTKCQKRKHLLQTIK